MNNITIPKIDTNSGDWFETAVEQIAAATNTQADWGSVNGNDTPDGEYLGHYITDDGARYVAAWDASRSDDDRDFVVFESSPAGPAGPADTNHAIIIACDTPQATEFCDYLVRQGHDACIGVDTGDYVDGAWTSVNDDAREIMARLWAAYCN